jgi:hypothetical protein
MAAPTMTDSLTDVTIIGFGSFYNNVTNSLNLLNSNGGVYNGFWIFHYSLTNSNISLINTYDTSITQCGYYLVGVRDFGDMINGNTWDPLFFQSVNQFTSTNTATIENDPDPLS